MTDKTRLLVHIPREENYIELLGYRIDGYDSLEAFLKELNKYAELKEENERLKAENERLKRTLIKVAFDFGTSTAIEIVKAGGKDEESRNT